EGEEVDFEVRETDKGLQAANVQRGQESIEEVADPVEMGDPMGTADPMGMADNT
ncbi:MAG: hypothetical protein GWM90_00640, partial [Gemmatimonadetes bacterium]|nr:hypothetical protein [Gemmatimonadota bacterium]NIU72136.1 hypothetical protein [Gammaproteobacteria bacterium]NIQ52039.1 hypothetical protein [Gemmatimonadota bacterium]NIW35109.1 hypothetical protein [Gemmatimonadota bacterium]NIX42691.1 hypothetical protein [Gemmatimonadota bacterium]